jgi:hypothetical protein
MSWLDNYIPSETDREISNFLSFHDAKKAAQAEVARHKYEVQLQQEAEAQAEAESTSEEPVTKPVENPMRAEVPPPVMNFLQNQRMALSLNGASAYQGAPKEAPSYPVDESLTLDPDKALRAIFGNEGGKTGQRTALKGSARGRYQIIDSTREMIRKGHFSSIPKDEFNRRYNSDAEFEHAVARAHMSDLIKTYGQYALSAWYSPKHVEQKRFNEVPNPEYGNKVTVGQYQENAMKRYKKFETGGETEEKPGASAPKGYKRRTKEQREAWNAMLNYAEEKGIAGKTELDDRNKNMSVSFLQEWNKAHPDKAISPEEIQYFQYELRGINDGYFPQVTTSKPEYAQIWGERMYKDKFNESFIQRQRSQPDNWFGSLTSREYYPQYEFVQGDKKIEYGVDYDKYAEAIFLENQKQKQKPAVRKHGGCVKHGK